MIFENITKNSVLNAVGRLVDPGSKIIMSVEYYAEYKTFIDGYVKKNLAKIEGIDEYKEFIKNGNKNEKELKEEKVDLIEEVRAEEEAESKNKSEPKKEEPKVEKVKEEPEEASKKKTPTRRRRATKKTDEEA